MTQRSTEPCRSEHSEPEATAADNRWWIVDVHTHLGSSSTLQVTGQMDDVLRIMDESGIQQAVLSPIPGYEDPRGVHDSMAQNDAIVAAMTSRPDRFPRGLGVVEPRHGSVALNEVDRVIDELGLIGLMFTTTSTESLPTIHPCSRFSSASQSAKT